MKLRNDFWDVCGVVGELEVEYVGYVDLYVFEVFVSLCEWYIVD